MPQTTANKQTVAYQSTPGTSMNNIIFKTITVNGRNLKYWSDDGGLSWYWVGKRAAPVSTTNDIN